MYPFYVVDYNIKYRSPISELTEVYIILFLAIGTSVRACAVSTLLLFHQSNHKLRSIIHLSILLRYNIATIEQLKK